MKNQIAFLIDTLFNGNRSSFSRKLGITPAFAAQLYSGERLPSDRTISDICRIFHVNEVWLRTGVGEPFIQLTREDEIAAALGSAIAGGSSSRDRLIRALARLPDDAFPIIESALLAAAEELKKDQ